MLGFVQGDDSTIKDWLRQKYAIAMWTFLTEGRDYYYSPKRGGGRSEIAERGGIMNLHDYKEPGSKELRK